MEIPSCGLCGSRTSWNVLLEPDPASSTDPSQVFGVVACGRCGLAQTSPRPTHSEIGTFYPPQYYPTSPPQIPKPAKGFSATIKRWIREDYFGYPPEYRRGRWQFLRRVLLWPEKVRRELRGRHVLPWVGKGRLLDVGCSAGGNLATFSSHGWDVYGLDNSKVAIECARKVVGDRVKLGDLSAVGFPDKFFDVIHFSHSLEHVFDPLGSLLEANRILTDHGLLAITVPNIGSVECRIFGRWWIQWDLPRHLYHFDKRTLSALLERAGFKVRACRSGIGTAFFMASLNQVLPHRYGVARPARFAQKVIEMIVAKPFCLLTGHLGYGTEIAVYAEKLGK